LSKFIECYFGQSGTAKSESAAAIITRIYNETGRTSRVLVGDGSAATYEGLVAAGVVELTDYTIRDWPQSTLSQLCQGFWPQDPLDPNSKLVPMTPEQFAKIGVYVIEGLSVGANYLMGDKKGAFAYRAARGEKIGQDSPIMVKDIDRNAAGQEIAGSGPGLVFGGNPLSHFGVAQKRMLGFVEQSKSLPGWVIWTAHERSAEDKISGAKLIGPEVAGGALTAVVSRVFNNTLHFATAEKTVKLKDEHTEKMVDVIDAEYRIYTRDHFRAEGTSYVKYKAVCRTPFPTGWTGADGKPAGAMPLYFTSDVPGQSINDFYDNIVAARQHQAETLRKPEAA